MDTYDWLLFLHVTGAFLVLGGAVMAGIFNFAALQRERPSEIAVLFRLARVAMIATTAAAADPFPRSVWPKVAGALLVLWVLANALGGIGGGREKQTRELAERLAAEGDAPSKELSSRLRDPVWLALSWGSGVVIVAILALMIWKPGT